MIRKKRNPDTKDIYSIDVLKKLSSLKAEERISGVVKLFTEWVWDQKYIKRKTIPNNFVNGNLSLQIALKPYFETFNKDIYRAVTDLPKKDYGYYKTLDVLDSVFQTSTKPLQNWSYSLDTADGYIHENIKYINLMFKTNAKFVRNNIIITPFSLNLYFDELLFYFDMPSNYKYSINLYKNYFKAEEELLLYSKTGDLFVTDLLYIK